MKFTSSTRQSCQRSAIEASARRSCATCWRKRRTRVYLCGCSYHRTTTRRSGSICGLASCEFSLFQPISSCNGKRVRASAARIRPDFPGLWPAYLRNLRPLQNEIVGDEMLQADKLDLEVGPGVAVDVAIDDRPVVRRASEV